MTNRARYDVQATPEGQKLAHMLAMQDTMNRTVNREWFTAGYRWTRAVMLEGAELIEHYNRWKWWKKNTVPDMPQVRLELVDIFHFALSEWMVRFGSADASDWVLNEAIMRRIKLGQAYAQEVPITDDAFNGHAEKLIGQASQGVFDACAFFALCKIAGLSFDDLYRLYIGKNLLNVFRQQYGYKTGRYLKNWDSVEDNVVLDKLFVAVVANHSGQALTDALLADLTQAYQKACEKGSWHCLESTKGPVLGQVLETAGERVKFAVPNAEPVWVDASSVTKLPIRESSV